MSQTLAQRLQEPDVVDLPDWAAADYLNRPDASLPVVVAWVPTAIGPGSIMATLGPTDGAALLNAVETAASSDPVMKWGLRVIESGSLDVSLPATRAQLDAMVSAGALAAAQRDALLSLSKRERQPSWAEVNNQFVDARAVGLARGGKA